MFSLSAWSSAPGSWSPLFAPCLFSASLNQPISSHCLVHSTGHVQPATFSLCSVIFQMPLAELFFIPSLKFLSSTTPRSSHPPFSLTMFHKPVVLPRGKDVTFYMEGPSENKALDASLEQSCFSCAKLFWNTCSRGENITYKWRNKSLKARDIYLLFSSSLQISFFLILLVKWEMMSLSWFLFVTNYIIHPFSM